MKLMPELTEKQIRRFWSKVDIKELDECWDWMGSLTKGYGKVKIQYVLYKAHRIAYFLHNTKDPGKLKVCHSCDNPACCNPNHLWIGTQLDNIRDCVQKGRTANTQGIKNGRAKLTTIQVQQIREQVANGYTQAAIANRFGINQSSVHFIATRKSWKHLNDN